MSLTSYRAAPPRVIRGQREGCSLSFAPGSRHCVEEGLNGLGRRSLGDRRCRTDLGRPGGDLLSRVLRQSTIGAEAFDGRVRDGIGSYRLAEGHQAGKDQFRDAGARPQVGERLAPRLVPLSRSVVQT